jgi:hypothetical protein
MLSILIPTYNYNVFSLVKELAKQTSKLNIDFEIICLDDGSKVIFIENEAINHLKNCSFSVNETNVGRASNLNKLVEKAKYNHCLLLEADAFPENENFIKKYVSLINENINIAFGGVIYSNKKPKADSLLRWIYGHKRESKNLDSRLKNPHNIVFSWNLLISKKLFQKFPFDTYIKDYGFEDFIFLKKLKENGVLIHQIDNNCIHQNEETSIEFIKKYNYSLQNLKKLIDSNQLQYEETSLSALYLKIKKLKLDGLVIFLFKLSKKLIIKNLTSRYCKLFLFDIYKLGYFCLHNQKKHV